MLKDSEAFWCCEGLEELMSVNVSNIVATKVPLRNKEGHQQEVGWHGHRGCAGGYAVLCSGRISLITHHIWPEATQSLSEAKLI